MNVSSVQLFLMENLIPEFSSDVGTMLWWKDWKDIGWLMWCSQAAGQMQCKRKIPTTTYWKLMVEGYDAQKFQFFLI